MADWRLRAEAVRIQGTSSPVFRLSHPFPLIAVVGILRPRVFVSAQLFNLLDHREILAALKHEAGHLSARDNLKCLLLRGCRDLLSPVPLGCSLEFAWRKAAEAAADEYAARAGGSAALDLASALIKIARLVPKGATPLMPASVFLMGSDLDGIAGRIQRLTQLAESGRAPNKLNEVVLSTSTWSLPCGLLAAITHAAFTPHILFLLHAATEHLFPLLS